MLFVLGLFLANRSAGPPQRLPLLQMAGTLLLACWTCDLPVKLNFKDSASYSVCVSALYGSLWTCFPTFFPPLRWQSHSEAVTGVPYGGVKIGILCEDSFTLDLWSWCCWPAVVVHAAHQLLPCHLRRAYQRICTFLYLFSRKGQQIQQPQRQ